MLPSWPMGSGLARRFAQICGGIALVTFVMITGLVLADWRESPYRADGIVPDAGGDATGSQRAPLLPGVVRLVGVQLGRAEAGTARPSPRSHDGRDGVEQRLEEHGVGRVGGRERDGERDARAVDQQVVLAAALASVDRIPAGLGAAPL